MSRLGCDYLPSDDELAWCIGPPLRDSYKKILRTEDPEVIETAIGYYRERYKGPGKFENRVYDGIPEVLGALKESGCRLLVCTAKPELYSNDIINHFGLRPYFDHVYGADLAGTLDHKPDLLAHLMRSEGLEPDKCLMIGDRKHDILAAKENGLRSIGVLWGYGSAEELRDAGANTLCKTPCGLEQAISQVSRNN